MDYKKPIDLLSRLKAKNSQLFIVFLAVYISVIIDLGLSKVTDLLPDEVASSIGIITFVVITSISSFGQYYFYSKTRSILKNSNFRPPYTRVIDNIVGVMSYSVIGINVIIILQVIFYSSYNIFWLLIINTVSYGLAAFLMGLLSKRFLSWFFIKRSIIVLIYGLAVAAISFNAITNVLYFNADIIDKAFDYTNGSTGLFDTKITPDTTNMTRNNYEPYPLPYGIEYRIFDAQLRSVDVYFTLSWIGTALLLLYNVRRIGRIKYWGLMSLALVYFFSYYWNYYDPFINEETVPNPILYFLFYTYSISVGGFLFGIGFWLISHSIRVKNPIKDFTMMVACSFLLLFTVLEATISQTSYPPFGVANVSFVGISAYLMLFGLSYSAISISKDVELRKDIRKMVIERSNLLGNIGDAEVEDEIINKVKFLETNKKELFAESSVGSSLSADEIKHYIDEVMDEIKKNALQK